MTMGVYAISMGDECLYVGQSVELPKRMKHHLWMLQNGCHSNVHLQNIANKYGAKWLVFEVVERIASTDVITDREKFWISELSPTCNMRQPMDSGLWGATAEMRKRISDGLKGRVKTPEEVEKIRQAHIGKKLSEGTKRKISESKQGVSIKRRHQPPTKDELVFALMGNGSYAASKRFGVSQGVVKYWCQDYGLPYKKSDWVPA
jgi:group I intron endonuclease